MHPESFPSIDQPSLLEKFKFSEQYSLCIRLLNETGVLELLPEYDTVGIVGMDGNPYPIPEERAILHAIDSTPYLKEKAEQGLTELSIVPAGAPILHLLDRLKLQILEHHNNGTLFSSDGTALELDTNQPIYHWDGIADDQLVYDPKEFSANHGGLTKAQFLKTLTFPGFDVLLTEPGEIPAQGKGQTLAGRKQPEANQTPNEYLALLTNPQYQHESGLTPEAWLTRFLHRLHTQNQVIDDWNGTGKFCYLTGSFHPASGSVPDGSWFRAGRRANLSRFGPRDRGVNYGSRFAVRIKKIGV